MEEYQEPLWRVAWRQQAENKWMVYGTAFYQFWDDFFLKIQTIWLIKNIFSQNPETRTIGSEDHSVNFQLSSTLICQKDENNDH